MKKQLQEDTVECTDSLLVDPRAELEKACGVEADVAASAQPLLIGRLVMATLGAAEVMGAEQLRP